MLPGYPSPQQIGGRTIRNLFDGPVVIQEKVDGSQISFGVNAEGELQVRSRGQAVNVLMPDKMFDTAVIYLKKCVGKMVHGAIYRGEYLKRPKHNALAYDRVPSGHIALFDIQVGGVWQTPGSVAAEAKVLGLDCVPVLFEGVLTPEELRPFLDRTSFLGGAKIEGVVVKNYALAAQRQEHFAGKFVSEAFKEIHGTPTGTLSPKDKRDIIERIIASLGTKARWAKAVQHMAERGALTDSVKDIGPLVKEVQTDVVKECEAEIKEWLYQDALPELTKGFVNGLAQWYKERLLTRSFETAELPETGELSDAGNSGSTFETAATVVDAEAVV